MVEIYGINVSFDFWQWFFGLPTFEMVGVIFALGGWVLIANFILKKIAKYWEDYRTSTRFASKLEYSLLAVDVPPLFVQTPKAVEQIFAHITGAITHVGIEDKFWTGKKQKTFSLEIVSIEGYIQFLIRTEVEYRDLVEASVYAQYPEAEITEVEDYVSNLPDKYPNDEYDVMGVEFKLEKEDAYPIRVYSEFEYSLSKEAVFSDPMAAILENFTRIGHGENLWMQIVVEPVDSAWKEKGIELAKGILKGEHGHGHGSGFLMEAMSALMGFVTGFLTEFLNNIMGSHPEEHEEHEERPEVTPGMKKTVEAIEEKISKVGFKNKLRVLYAARKEVFNPGRCVNGFIGSMNQFNMQDRNAIVPALATHAHYDSKHVKSNVMKTEFVAAYKKRKMKGKTDGNIMNTEEMATLWHFPLPFVKTPLLHKAGHKRGEPPTGLPIEVRESPLKPKSHDEHSKEEEHKEEPPEELQYG